MILRSPGRSYTAFLHVIVRRGRGNGPASQDELLDAGPGEHLLERASFGLDEAEQ